MKIGFLGLGKLGLPAALAIERCGHDVVGYDPAPQVQQILDTRNMTYRELWAQELLDSTKIAIESVSTVVEHSEIIFVPIQTPHDPAYEGTTPVPPVKKDFDYQFLVAGIQELEREISRQKKQTVVVIISTVLPGTLRRLIIPLVQDNVYFQLGYNPFFIAMGIALKDFLDPEFVLFGVDNLEAAETAERFYRTIHKAPFFKTTLENAEIIKVLYNTFISTKIGFANTAMELCHKLPNTNVDEVMRALKLGKRRILSDAYFDGGMGDGGGCHPRDNIALAWLSEEIGLSYNWFDCIIQQRERQTGWLADLIEAEVGHLGRHDEGGACCPVYILGKTFKPETNITTGSPALLLTNILDRRSVAYSSYDPHVDTEIPEFKPGVYFIATAHSDFETFRFPPGSVVIDPWRLLSARPSREEVRFVGVGARYQ